MGVYAGRFVYCKPKAPSVASGSAGEPPTFTREPRVVPGVGDTGGANRCR